MTWHRSRSDFRSPRLCLLVKSNQTLTITVGLGRWGDGGKRENWEKRGNRSKMLPLCLCAYCRVSRSARCSPTPSITTRKYSDIAVFSEVRTVRSNRRAFFSPCSPCPPCSPAHGHLCPNTTAYSYTTDRSSLFPIYKKEVRERKT